jgi:putative transposase
VPTKAGSANGGIDPGFLSLVTLSTGEKLEHPRELQRTARRLSQAQRGLNRRLVAGLREREANQRKDRNHKLSRRLVSENTLIAWSDDQHQNIARIFGKSVASAAHGQLKRMLSYKCRAGGRQFIEVPSRNSTKTCSACGALTGPAGYAGLKVRQWVCVGCGVEHDRDVNAALNALAAGRGLRHERTGDGSPEIAA